MKIQISKSIALNEKQKSFSFSHLGEFLRSLKTAFLQKLHFAQFSGRIEILSKKSHHFLEDIKSLGFTKTMDELDRGKLSVFNQLNFFQLITGVIVPLTCFFGNHKFPLASFFIASLPAWVSFIVLYLNFYYKYEAGMIVYFILYPVVTSIVYMNGMNLGVELFFILYGILAVFFLQDLSQMLFSIGLSMISYFILAVVCKNYSYQLQTANFFFYLFNQITAIVFIFYGLFLIKKENSLYQLGILATNHALQDKNVKIEKQKAEIEEKARELDELNSLKNKLFSVISHDLKTPMYALRNLFSSMQQLNLSGTEIKAIIPDVVTDLSYTTGLMENLLQWAKSQMNSASIHRQPIDMGEMIENVLHIQQLQAAAKKINISVNISEEAIAFADKDMIQLVLRNLLSNAIKFTPQQGHIEIHVTEEPTRCNFSVKDNGVGISEESLKKINENNYYSTGGTSNESGTGLGLMLCKEFLLKNGAELIVSSTEDKGSEFRFSLPTEPGTN